LIFAVFERRLIQHSIDCMQFFLYNGSIKSVVRIPVTSVVGKCKLGHFLGCQVKAACIGTRIKSAPPVDILPRHKPQLHKIQPKDPVALENCGYVSKFILYLVLRF